MLTAEHVRAFRKSGELVLRPLSERERPRALELARAYREVALAHVGRRREELVEAWAGVAIGVREKRLADGLKKLVEDECGFAAQAPVEPMELRSGVFLAASAARRELKEEERFDRARVLEAASRARGLPIEEAERALYADLKGEQLLLAMQPIRAETLVERYEHGQVQAVLLRAVRVVADVTCRSPSAYRALFRELKFRRLLFRITPRGSAGYRLEIDGPYSLFDSVTKYGLELALILPALEACDALALVAEVRWGKQRDALVFKHQHLRETGATSGQELPRLRDDVAALIEAFQALGSPWRVSEGVEILELPGVGLCVPDLAFENPETGVRVHFEALGFWSREAVWKRVELVQQGLPEPILFAVSSRLRVSEAVLDEGEAGGLYVYKGTMSARAVLRKLEDLARRNQGPPG